MTPTEEKVCNLVIEWRNTRGEIATAFIELEMKKYADMLIKERRDAKVKEVEKGQ